MKHSLALLVMVILLTTCSNTDDDGVDCTLFDPAFPELYIRLVDETGANLIENGTIDPESITVDGNFSNPGFIYIPPNEFADPDSDIRKYDHTVLLLIPNEPQFEYKIHLNETTSIVLEFEAKFAQLPCGISYFIPTKLTFNNETIDSENQESELRFLAEIQL